MSDSFHLLRMDDLDPDPQAAPRAVNQPRVGPALRACSIGPELVDQVEDAQGPRVIHRGCLRFAPGDSLDLSQAQEAEVASVVPVAASSRRGFFTASEAIDPQPHIKKVSDILRADSFLLPKELSEALPAQVEASCVRSCH